MFEIEVHFQIGADARQVVTHVGGFLAGFEFALPAFFDLVEVLINAVERAEFFEQADGGLFADALHAGDVVGGVADDGFVIDHLVGAYAEFADDIFIGDVGLVVAREINRSAFVDQLQQVSIAGDDFDSQAFFSGDARHRAEHIVRFVAFHFEARDVE